MSNLRDILRTAIPDPRIQIIIEGFGFREVIGMSFKFQDAYAFALGGMVLGFPRGIVYVSDWLISQFSPKELEWIVLHELAHIIYDDIRVRMGPAMLSFVVTCLFGLVSKSVLALILTFLLSRPFVARRTVIITEYQELRADWFASTKQRIKNYGINALWKLSRGDIGQFSHIATGFMFQVPVLTFQQRIDELRRDP